MKLRFTALCLVCIGLIIFLFPWLSETYHDNQQQLLLEEWQKTFETISIEEELPESESIESIDAVQTVSEPIITAEEPIEITKDMEGVLTIDTIELQMPVLKGATEEHLRTTIASIENTGSPGEVGNFAIAGHRNRTFGSHFNRLDELEAGDAIDFNTGEQIFHYEVTDKLYVEPHEVWVLEAEGTEKEITLVTCHPIETGTHRLIIKGKLIEA